LHLRYANEGKFAKRQNEDSRDLLWGTRAVQEAPARDSGTLPRAEKGPDLSARAIWNDFAAR